ncbi:MULTISPECIES: BrnT family toxin [unclassified Mesorhizobium]|uniref:BrnT family toxin n=1 Tax=unclassified Mesorhizobium TaxID=325217 RepID=UPI00112A4495|nr:MULTISPECIES: BrnT family toxin [unclassified Mesorhizobium]TPI17347.1 BrnT family toxin [Mesorhizobium sp. B4-1-1]TPL47466.1 BrnT family toxin [Mesorhizobium sp. B2-4-6]
MRFEWDPEKAWRNLAKHGVAFDLAKKVFDDPLHLIVPDRFEDGEQRWHAIGMVGIQVILLVVHTYPTVADEEHVRIVGARKATPHERRRYEQEGP